MKENSENQIILEKLNAYSECHYDPNYTPYCDMLFLILTVTSVVFLLFLTTTIPPPPLNNCRLGYIGYRSLGSLRDTVVINIGSRKSYTHVHAKAATHTVPATRPAFYTLRTLSVSKILRSKKKTPTETRAPAPA